MKKIMFVLALFALAVPVWATTNVEITCAQVPDEPHIIISYNDQYNTGSCEPGMNEHHVVAFSLDLQLDNDETIVAVECLSADYYIYPGSIQINDQGEVTNAGSCFCDDSYAGTLPGLDSNGVTIEMASLYDNVPPLDDPCHICPPAPSGQLLKITVSGETCITISVNELRGGVVLKDLSDVDPCVPDDCCVTGLDCFPSTDPMYQNWVDVGKPGSWCCDYQALGDTNGDGAISALDLFLSFKPAYNTQHGVHPAYDPAADFNHDKAVSALDLFLVFKPNYNTNPGPGYDCPHD